MFTLFIGAMTGFICGFLIASAMVSGKMFDEARQAFNEGVRVGKLESRI